MQQSYDVGLGCVRSTVCSEALRSPLWTFNFGKCNKLEEKAGEIGLRARASPAEIIPDLVAIPVGVCRGGSRDVVALWGQASLARFSFCFHFDKLGAAMLVLNIAFKHLEPRRDAKGRHGGVCTPKHNPMTVTIHKVATVVTPMTRSSRRMMAPHPGTPSRTICRAGATSGLG